MFNSVLAQSIQRKIEKNLGIELMSIIISRRMIDISKQHTGELLTKMTIDIQAVSKCFVNISKDIIGSAFMASLSIIGLFYLNWKMAIIMLVLLPLTMLIIGVFNPRIKNASDNDKKNEEIIRSNIQENLNRIMLIKTYFMQQKIIDKIKLIYTDKIKCGKSLGVWEGLISFSGILLANVMFMAALGVGAYFVLRGETTVGSLIAIVQLLNFIVEPVSTIINSISQISQAIASANRIGTIYELPSDKDIKMIHPVDAIELSARSISFTYDTLDGGDSAGSFLEKISASFQRGAITGIVGKSGSGKSTLLKILIGLYSPHKGSVELKHTNGVLNGEELLTQVAYVPPADYLFTGTIVDNIVMSDTEPCFDDIKNASIDAGIFDFIESLPYRFDSTVGESGGTVSSGQAQRIAIARAIYKKSPIIVFDEPTANLDVEATAKFHSTIKRLAKDKICIIVTHDTSTMAICDKVYVLENSNIREKNFNEGLETLDDIAITTFDA